MVPRHGWIGVHVVADAIPGPYTNRSASLHGRPGRLHPSGKGFAGRPPYRLSRHLRLFAVRLGFGDEQQARALRRPSSIKGYLRYTYTLSCPRVCGLSQSRFQYAIPSFHEKFFLPGLGNTVGLTIDEPAPIDIECGNDGGLKSPPPTGPRSAYLGGRDGGAVSLTFTFGLRLMCKSPLNGRASTPFRAPNGRASAPFWGLTPSQSRAGSLGGV